MGVSPRAACCSPGAYAVLAKLPASLRSLDLSHNPLGRGDGGLEGRPDGGAALPAALEDLSLAECGLQSLEVHAWGGLHQLRRLQLSGNGISVLSDMAHMHALEHLNVSRGALTYFPTVQLAALRVLDVSHNQLENAPAPLAPELSVLLLDDNPIEQLRLAVAPSLTVLSASNMPLLRAVPNGAVRLAHEDFADFANATAAPCLAVTLRDNPALVDIGEDAFPASLCQVSPAKPARPRVACTCAWLGHCIDQALPGTTAFNHSNRIRSMTLPATMCTAGLESQRAAVAAAPAGQLDGAARPRSAGQPLGLQLPPTVDAGRRSAPAVPLQPRAARGLEVSSARD